MLNNSQEKETCLIQKITCILCNQHLSKENESHECLSRKENESIRIHTK